MKRLTVVLAGAALVLGMSGRFAPRACAQDDVKPDSLEKKQKAIAEAWKQLEELLNQSASSFSRTEPEKAAKIRRAYEASKSAFEGNAANSSKSIADRMREVLELLGKHHGKDALVGEKECSDALERVLELLEQDERKAGEHLDPKRIEALLEEVKKLIQQQKEHKTQVEKARDLEAIARALTDAGKKLDEVYAAQKQLVEKTGDAKSEAMAELGKSQREIEAQTSELQKLLEAVQGLKTPGEDAKPGDAKPGDAKPGDAKPGDAKPGDQKPGDAKPGEQKPGDQKPGEQKPGEQKPGEQKPGDAKPGEQKPGDAKPGEQKPGDQKPGDQKPGDQKPGEQKPGDQKPGEQKPGEQKPGEQKPGEQKPGDQKPGDAKPGDAKPGDASPGSPSESAASKAVASAKGAMGEAAKKLDDQKKDEALERERKVLEDLEAAKTSLDKKRQQIERLAQLDRLKAEEERLKQQTDELSKRMGDQSQNPQNKDPKDPKDAKPGQPGQPGQPKSGKSGKGSSSGKSQGPVPGKRHVERAEEEQQKAGDDLENRYVKDASDKEEQAVEELKQAEEAMREALVQARKREQEELLKALGSQFVEMLAKQRELTKRTEALDKERLGGAPAAPAAPIEKVGEKPAEAPIPAAADVPRPDLTRSQRSVCSEITKGEGELRDQAERANELVKEEGSSTVLPIVVNEVHEDLARLAELLDKRDTGRFVVSLQHDVERSLEELIEVIKKEIEERKGGGGGGGGGGGKQEDPLLPASAELKMIKAQQLRVNSKTKEFDVGRGQAEKDLTPDQREACRHIAEKQARVAEFTRRLHLKLNKQEQ